MNFPYFTLPFLPQLATLYAATANVLHGPKTHRTSKRGRCDVHLLCLAIEELEPRLVPNGTLFPTFQGSHISSLYTASVADLNGDGWQDALGALNDQQGNLVSTDPIALANSQGLGTIFLNGRAYRDAVVADFLGNGLPDIVCNTYSGADDITSQALLFLNNGDGTFREDQAFTQLNIRGHGENIVVADFTNDGLLDMFLPYYTFPYDGTVPDPGG